MSVSSVLFATGAVIAGLAPSFAVFILGRVVMGVGGAGIFIISMVLVLHFVKIERRGLFIGLVNTFYTAGVVLGAIIAGALAPAAGWVSL
jgi:MFS family permease